MPKHRRRGSLYISVLFVTLIVSLIGVSAMHVARLHLKGAMANGDHNNARLLAMSGVEHAISEFNTNSNWETDYTFDTEYPSTPPAINGGTFSWKLIDQGSGSRQLDGIGRVGDAECVFRVDLSLASDNVLDCALLSGGNLIVNLGTSMTVNGAPLGTNGTLTNFGSITADIEAQTVINGGTITGTQTVPGPIRTPPDATQVFEYYMSRGTVIPDAAIPVGAHREIQNFVLSPSSNPFGPTNPDGIYIIDSPGNIRISNCRIVGTLVIRNPGKHVDLENEINWEPAHPHLPALLVEGDLHIKITDNSLSEAWLGVNFNPSGTPYYAATDTDQTDSYLSAIAGIVYATGKLKFKDHSARIQGVVISGGPCTVEFNAQPVIEYDSTFLNNTPPGLEPGDPKSISPGSWQQTPSN